MQAQPAGLCGFRVVEEESDLLIYARRQLASVASSWLRFYRSQLKEHIGRHPEFASSLAPLGTAAPAPGVVRDMARAARAAGVGPMAAVAGAIAERVGRRLGQLTPEVIVENGGDIYLSLPPCVTRRVAIWAGDSALTGRLALVVEGRHTPAGVCTSSGTHGHSLSFGKADAAVVIADSAALADAVATQTGNLVREAADIGLGLGFASRVRGVRGAVIIVGAHVGAWGQVELAPAQREDV
jgi:ApbE superfamily uncharacterized protein (UPF0280 family)